MLDSRLLLPAATLCCVLILVRTSFSQTTAVQFLGQSPFTAYVSRASPPGHPIYRFVAINSTDRSANGISYTLVQGSQSLFQIHTETGQLANLEYLPLKSFPLTVEAELNSKITTAELTVRVLPEYTTTPRFEHTSFHFATSEYTPVGTPFAVIQAFSLDPQTTVQGYSIARGNTDSDLAINATTGVLLVAHELDRERTPSYNLYICYKESGAEIEVSVDVSVSDENDNSPEFSQLLYEARVSELNPPDTPVVSVSAADRDTGENGMVGYRLDSEVDMFAIDESSGEVVLAGNLNHEQQSMYTFTVVAEDRGQPAQTSTAIVVVAVTNEDDECPQFDSQNYAAMVPPSLVMQDMELLTVHAVDPDSTSGVMYAIVSGNELQALNLDPGTGLITLSSTTPNSYVLNITATSDGVCADQSTVQAEISIAATNEHSPQFQGPCVGEIEENVPTETLVTTLSALDDDTGVYGQISYTFIEDSQLFRVHPATGEIYTTGELDHEQTAYHLIGATATDGGNRQTYCLLNITVLDVNDHHPSFLAQDGYTIMLHLNSPPGAFVLQALAEDPDTGMNGAIEYSLSDPAGIFNIDSSNGRIRTAASIATMSYSLAVEASDMGDPPQTSSISVNVIVVNDSNVPAFNQSVYSMTICENLPFLTDVLQVHSRTSNGILYQLLSGSEYYTNGDGVFSIDTEGQISVTSQGVIDFERLPQSQFQFSVSAQNTLGMISGMAAIVIDVLDQDDNGPIFPSPDIEASISENMPEGTLVTQLAAVDPDSGTNGEVTYSVSLGEDKFQVTSSGEVLSLMPFDAESTQLNILRIVASNPNPVNNVDPCPVPSRQSATVVIRVSILDVNDNPPTIETTGSLTLPENTAVGTTVHTFSATDPDSSDNGLLIYTITGGNTDHSFQIDNTGALSLLQALDYERMSEYTLTVQVSDGSHTGTTSLDISVTDVDDEPPVFDQAMYTGGVIENAPIGTSILQVSAEDVDTPSVRYWLTGPAVGRLSIGSGGEVAVAGNVDREEFPNGIMSFLAVAEGGGLTTTNITINISDVNDYTPHFTDVEVGSVLENTEPGPSGIPVTTVQAIDLDSGANGAVTYMLVQGEEDGFQIDPNTGEITAHDVYDREETPSYTLLVEAVDSGAEVQLSSTTVVQVLIGDVDDNTPYLPFTYIFARVFENAAVGTEVIRIPAIDLDEGDNAIITYTYISSSPEEMKYSIDSTTGTVMVNGNLDYENPLHRVFNLTFSLADSPTPAELEIHLLDENDNTPVLTMSEMPLGSFLSENTPVGTLVLMITATDEDTGTNAEIVFSILNGDPSRDFQIMFGNSVASISTARQLDYETTSSYDIIIEACDLGTPQRCSTKEVDLSIANVNDVSPSFSETPYTASIVENTSPVASILQVSATDTDFGSNFVYGIESGNSNGYFALNSSSGVLSSTVPLDREEQDTYVLVVTAVDSGTSPLTGTGTVIISVTDVNDNPSSESMSWIEMVLLDGQLQAGMLGPVFFSDPDSTYTFTGCSVVEIENAASLFSVDQDNCTLSLEQSNPPEGTYSLGISGNDGQNPAVVSRVNINIIHLSSSDIPLDSLVTISLAMSAADYLSNTYTSFPTALSDVLGTDRDLLTIISVQPGYQDPDTVDVSFTVRTSDGSYLDPTYVLQALFTHRDSLASSGYILSALPADPCSSEPCFNEANCKPRTAITGSSMTAESSQFALISPVVQLDYECQCVPGTSGKDCSINYDDCYSSPCLYGAECVDGVNGFQCDCPLGTTGPDCSGTPDECSSTPCQNGATCENTPGSHTCHCVPGYYGPECQYHYFRAAPTCASSPCQNGATCSSGWDTFTCLCPDGYSGQLCDQPVVVQGGCTGNPCYNGSTCSESLSGPVCTCSVGFTGPLCRWPVDSCELEPCQNEGTCATGLYSSYQCYCPLPYTGQDCGEVIPGCESSPCQNGGRCSDAGGGGYSCECTRGFYGDNCEYSVQPQNLCSGSPCLSGNCTYGRDAYTCTCTSGHSGAQCEHASPLLTACDSNPCQHGSTCEGGAVDYTCLCSSGFTGPNCEININDCGPSQCQHGTCQDGINGLLCECDSEQITGYHCEVYCPDGHSGSFCETSTLLCNTDPSPCQNGGTCLEGGSSYSCVCPPGRTGSTCELESSCDVVECHNGEVCSALPGGGYGCECPDGFQGPNCELVTLSFTSASSYRTYQSLELRGQGSIQFEFNTLDSEGLLLYNTQLQAGTSRDYIAAEVSGGQLVVGVSRGGNRAVATATSSAVAVSDGQWHRVTIETSGKVQGRRVAVSCCAHAWCIVHIHTTDMLLQCTFIHDLIWFVVYIICTKLHMCLVLACTLATPQAFHQCDP